jgi:hypothetical protein
MIIARTSASSILLQVSNSFRHYIANDGGTSFSVNALARLSNCLRYVIDHDTDSGSSMVIFRRRLRRSLDDVIPVVLFVVV